MTPVLVVVALAVLLPWGAVPAASRLSRLLAPREAALALAGAAVLLAGGTVAVLVALLHVPFLAGLEQLPLTGVATHWPAVLPVAGVAGVLLVVQAVRLVRAARRHRALLSRAWQLTGGARAEGDVLIVPGAEAEAFALPSHRGRAGRVVVTEGMLETLEASERAVLLAHERAHLQGRHHLFSAAADLAAAVHPALARLRTGLEFPLERWADEAAARSVSDRRLAATAIARAALAGAAGPGGHGAARPLSVSTGPVPLRVQALLAPAPAGPEGRSSRLAVAGLLAAVVASAVLALGLAYGLHEYVEYAAEALTGR
ncbi:M48 family metalloprotease [Kitasatospora purpeofusca]|uniref:M48 family metalloprotease n=1 Tax=Kitasatospora purpeofusca TaxID=67352 RepID=UPI002A5AAF88|nr:M48 family metalloprotease [Kitasatospora purpeofusca]MDY0812223.1 M48 family metalloprotease [Kitasatospora purpeofusca]